MAGTLLDMQTSSLNLVGYAKMLMRHAGKAAAWNTWWKPTALGAEVKMLLAAALANLSKPVPTP